MNKNLKLLRDDLQPNWEPPGGTRKGPNKKCTPLDYLLLTTLLSTSLGINNSELDTYN